MFKVNNKDTRTTPIFDTLYKHQKTSEGIFPEAIVSWVNCLGLIFQGTILWGGNSSPGTIFCGREFSLYPGAYKFFPCLIFYEILFR